MRTKAELRATRERVGLTQAKLAEAVGVQVRSVKRWESPEAPQNAPEDVWLYLGDLLQAQDEAVDAAVARAKPEELYQLQHYANHEECPDGYWRVANATARAIAITLEAQGFGVEWID